MQLRGWRIIVLVDAQEQQPHNKGRIGWKTSQDIGLAEEGEEEWNRFLNKLVARFFHLDEETQDKIIWTKNAKDGEFSAKQGYEVASNELEEGEKRRWWRKIWGTHSPLKTIINLWLALSNKLLTQEILRKRGFQGLLICIPCKTNE